MYFLVTGKKARKALNAEAPSSQKKTIAPDATLIEVSRGRSESRAVDRPVHLCETGSSTSSTALLSRSLAHTCTPARRKSFISTHIANKGVGALKFYFRLIILVRSVRLSALESG